MAPADSRPHAAPAANAWDADLRSIGLAPDPATIDALARYLALLARWNAHYNLTAVRDPAAMWIQHVLDCAAAVPSVALALRGIRSPSIVDVGSGGGLPGVVWALLMPGTEVHCVDAVGKKAAFIRQVAGQLALPSLHAVHARAEQVGGTHDLVTSRAFASLTDFTSCTRHLLGAGGRWVAMKGRTPDDEIAALPADVDVFHVEQLQVPHLGAPRCLVWMRPAADAEAHRLAAKRP